MKEEKEHHMDGDMYGCIGGRLEKEKKKMRNVTTEHLQWTQRQGKTPLRGGDKKEMLNKRGIKENGVIVRGRRRKQDSPE